MAKNGIISVSMKVGDRLRLLGILPAQGGIATVRLVRELRDKLALKAEEIESMNVKTVGESVVWDSDKDVLKSFPFSGFEIELIVSNLKRYDAENKLTVEMVSLWDNFVEKKE